MFHSLASRIALAIIGSLATTSCINMSSMTTAEALPPGKGEVILAVGYYTSPSINQSIEDESDTNTSWDEIKVPYLEGGYRYGAMDKLEIAGSYTLPGTLRGDVKYQFLDQGAFDMASGIGLGYFSISSTTGSAETEREYKNTVLDITVPLHMSYRFAPEFALYGSPKYILRTVSSTVSGPGRDASDSNDSTSTSLIGATFGSKIGSNAGVILEASYFKAAGSDFDVMQLGVGTFF